MVDLRMPNINGTTEREMIAQIRSYLYQFVPQLQWALDNLNTSSSQSSVSQTIIKETTKSNTPMSAEVSFNELKSLIIKSADIVNAYYEEINERLYSEYSALSDFGTYTEQTEKLVRETASFTEETYSRLATIEGDIDLMRKSEGYIKTGIIVDSLSAKEAKTYGKLEGDSLIGVEVGETNDGVFTKFARFTPNRLSFYDQNGTEVAYISDYKLYIKNVEITSSYKIGGLVDTVMSSGDVVTKWVGGDG